MPLVQAVRIGILNGSGGSGGNEYNYKHYGNSSHPMNPSLEH